MDGPFKQIEFGPLSGYCCLCNKKLGAYWNKFLNLKTGIMACPEHHRIKTDLVKLGFVSYSDG